MAPRAFGVAEVERPQPGGAGCGYTSLAEALMSSMDFNAVVDNQATTIVLHVP
jgi:hypothetical protein